MHETAIWLELKTKVHPSLKKLCELCYNYFDFNNFLCGNAYPSLTGMDISKVISLVHEIIGEFIKVVRTTNKLDLKKVEKLENDIHKMLSVFFTDKGIAKPLTTVFTSEYERGTLDFQFPLFTGSFDAFINTKILNSLKESYENSLNYQLKGFSTSALEKAYDAPPEKKEGVSSGKKEEMEIE